MPTRIHIVLESHERDSFRARAAAEGQSLSAWLREAGRDRLRRSAPQALRSEEDLAAFFAECRAREQGREPDWEEHLAVIAASRAEGRAPT